jgi:hypothetical protein
MLRSRIIIVSLALTIAVLTAGILSSQAGAVSATPPHIVAKPNNLMVNTKTTLTGTGYPAKTTLTIEECSITNWVVTANPCVKTNKISVLTDRHGHFVRQFRVTVCNGKHGPIITSVTCYIGDPHPEGVDTISLLGAAKVTVTYP